MALPSLGTAIGFTGTPKDYTAQTIQGIQQLGKGMEEKKARKKAGEEKGYADILKSLTVDPGKYHNKQIKDVQEKVAGYITNISKAYSDDPGNFISASAPLIQEANAYIAQQQSLKGQLDEVDKIDPSKYTNEQRAYMDNVYHKTERLSQMRDNTGKFLDANGMTGTIVLDAADVPKFINERWDINIPEKAHKIANDADYAFTQYESGVTPLGEHQNIYTKGKTPRAEFVRKAAEIAIDNDAALQSKMIDEYYDNIKKLDPGYQQNYIRDAWINTVMKSMGGTKEQEIRTVPSGKGIKIDIGGGVAGDKFNIDPGKETFTEYKERGGTLPQGEYEKKFVTGGNESIKFTRTDATENTVQPLKDKDGKSIQARPLRLIFTDGKWQLEVESIIETASDGIPATTEKLLVPYSGLNRETVEGEYKDKSIAFGEYLKDYNKRIHKDEDFGLRNEPETLEKMKARRGKGGEVSEVEVKSKIRVRRKSDGKIGSIIESDFSESKYEKL